jgi:soluble lytic murein transglycosylase-like protein
MQMDKQKKQAIGQMILAAALCAAVVIPGTVAVNRASAREQAEQRAAEQARREAVLVVLETPSADSSATLRMTADEPEVKMPLYDVPLCADLQYYIIDQSMAKGIDPAIILAMIDRESDFDPANMGDNGQAYGLMQIWPKWHSGRMERLGCTDLLDPYQNVTVGLDYLCELLSRYDGDMAKALVAYNQGQYKGTVTQYAKAVMAAAERMETV